MSRTQFFVCENGEKAPLPFSKAEYERRLKTLRGIMAARGVDAVLFTSMHNIAYYSGFLYCSCTFISSNSRKISLFCKKSSNIYKNFIFRF